MAVSREVQGVEAPAVGTWKLDPSHTRIGAIARHLMVTKVRGEFKAFEGAIHIAERPEESRAELTIDASSIDTGVADRDAHLRSPDFLDVERYPQITFRSTSVERTGPQSLRVTGDLTVRGVTRPVDLDVTYEGLMEDPWGGTRAGFTVTGELVREDWGMTWNVALEKGGLLVSKSVELDIEVQAVHQAEAIAETHEQQMKSEDEAQAEATAGELRRAG